MEFVCEIKPFHGTYTRSIDDKGRTILPARVRDYLVAMGESTLVITKWPRENCLKAFPCCVWQKFSDKISEQSKFEKKLQALRHYFLGSASHCEIKANGRIKLEKELREYAAINKESVWVGMGNEIEIWSPENWRIKEKEEENLLLDNPEEFEKTMREYGL